MSTLGELLCEGRQILESAQMPEAGLDAWLLLEYVTGVSRAYYFAHEEEAVPEEKQRAYLKLVRRRREHIPLQQLTGQAFFMGHEFYVNEHVLIPRQDTEILAETALEKLRGVESPRLLDMCTGSGCILLSLLLEKETAAGEGVDISEKALEVARRNGGQLGLSDRVTWIKSDLFASADLQKTPGYDMLVSNPPYIRSAEIDTLMEEVRLHEPRLALDGHGDGLYFYRRICEEGRAYLRAGGWLLFEIGCDQAGDVAELLASAGFSQVEIRRDLSGLDRVALGRKPA